MTLSLSARLGLVLSLGFALLSGLADLAHAQSCEPQVARAASVQGTVEMRRGAAASWQPVKLNDAFCPGDTIRVQERSRADVTLLDQSVLRLNAGAMFTVQAVKDQRTSVIELLQGAAHFFSRGPRSLEVQTPFTVAGVRGTEFYVNVESDRTLLTVFEGTVAADNAAGSLALASGQSAVAERGKAPVAQIVARPRDAVQWALYYPPVVYFRPDEFAPGPDWPGAVRASLEASTAGDLQQAFDRIGNVPDTVSDPRFFTYRASLLLAVGRVDEAGADIKRALSLRANDPNALALQTIIAVAQNDKDQALQVAQQAVQAAPDSASALIALSYAQQARFDLEGARASLEEAVKREPENALAWARLAEIHSSFGNLDKSLEAAQKAVSLQPNLARTQTVLGFAYLTQVKTKEARRPSRRPSRWIRPTRCRGWGWDSRRSATATSTRAAATSRWPRAWTRATPSSAATWARPTTRRSAARSTSASTRSPSSSIRRTPRPGSTTRSRSRRRTGRSRPSATSRRRSS